MKTKILMALLCLCPLFVAAQNYEQQGDELFAQAQYEKAVKKYKAAEVYAEMNNQATSSQLKAKKEKAQQCADLLKKATTAEENNQYAEATTAYSELYSLHALESYNKKSQTYKEKKKKINLIDLIIPNGTKEIKYEAYYNRKDIRTVSIPNSVTSIGVRAFSDCKNLTSISIPNSVISIESSAFNGCTSLTSITIPNSVTSIGNGAFNYCTSLTSIHVPSNVKSIGTNAFMGVANVVYSGAATGRPWSARCFNGHVEGYIVYKDKSKKELLACSSAITGDVVMPQGVTSIGYEAFIDCKGMTSITIPNSVKSIGASAFMKCTGLTSVTISNSVTSIGEYAFWYCMKLTSFTIPNSVTNIGNGAFSGCSSLTSIEIPNSVTNIGEYAFAKCKGLTIKMPERFRGKVYVSDCKKVIYY